MSPYDKIDFNDITQKNSYSCQTSRGMIRRNQKGSVLQAGVDDCHCRPQFRGKSLTGV